MTTSPPYTPVAYVPLGTGRVIFPPYAVVDVSITSVLLQFCIDALVRTDQGSSSENVTINVAQDVPSLSQHAELAGFPRSATVE